MATKSFPSRFSYWRMLWDSARITQDVFDHQYTGLGTTEDPFVVEWIAEDPGNPMNLPARTRWMSSLVTSICTLAVALNSSAFSGAIAQYATAFDASEIVITLGVSLFVLGFALGPLIWSPVSELYGRRLVYCLSYGGFTAFNGGAIGSKNIETLLILRFLAGAFGSAPLTIGGGTVSDVFKSHERGLAMGVFALAPFLGPTIGPLCGGFLGESAGWKWVSGFLTILSGTLWLAVTFLMPETYHPTLLRARAKKMSILTGKHYTTQHDLRNLGLSVFQIFSTSISRPLVLLFKEPIVLLLSIYMAIIYGTLYMFFSAYPIIYQHHRGWSEGIGGLAFLGVAVGMVVAWFCTFPDAFNYTRKLAKSPSGRLAPEERLYIAMFGSIALPVGIFWFAWTNNSSVHWLASVAAGAPFGFGMVAVFVAVINYLVDVYTIYAASVLAANSVLRSLFGFAFPLFTPKMYDNLGIHWASSIPACLALLCVPMPFLFFKYGPTIRARCKYASESEKFIEQQMTAAVQMEKKVVAQDVEAGASFELHRVPTVAEVYEASPYDIDRAHTTASEHRGRASNQTGR